MKVPNGATDQDAGRQLFERGPRMLLKAGTLLTIENGEYSDFTYVGPFKVLCDFDQAAVVADYAAEWPAERERMNAEAGYRVYDDDDPPSLDGFIPFLARRRLIEDVQSSSWYIGGYGRLDPEIPE